MSSDETMAATQKQSPEAAAAAAEEERLLHGETVDDIDMSWNDEKGFVYVAMSSDIVHHGHINIIQEAAKLGKVVVGLMTDASIQSYKRKPIIPYKYRKIVVDNLKGVYKVIPQTSIDYCPNVRLLKAAWVVHGTDWRTGPQAKSRQKIIDMIGQWGGKLHEPEYTSDVSTTEIIFRCYHQCSAQMAQNATEPELTAAEHLDHDCVELQCKSPVSSSK